MPKQRGQSNWTSSETKLLLETARKLDVQAKQDSKKWSSAISTKNWSKGSQPFIGANQEQDEDVETSKTRSVKGKQYQRKIKQNSEESRFQNDLFDNPPPQLMPDALEIDTSDCKFAFSCFIFELIKTLSALYAKEKLKGRFSKGWRRWSESKQKWIRR